MALAHTFFADLVKVALLFVCYLYLAPRATAYEPYGEIALVAGLAIAAWVFILWPPNSDIVETLKVDPKFEANEERRTGRLPRGHWVRSKVRSLLEAAAYMHGVRPTRPDQQAARAELAASRARVAYTRQELAKADPFDRRELRKILKWQVGEEKRLRGRHKRRISNEAYYDQARDVWLSATSTDRFRIIWLWRLWAPIKLALILAVGIGGLGVAAIIPIGIPAGLVFLLYYLFTR